MAQYNNLPIYSLILNDEEINDGCYKISLVEAPAIDETFLKFKKDSARLDFAVQDATKRIVTGIAMRADYPIYRNQDGKEFYVVFPKETIEKMMYKFMKEQNQFNISLDHTDDVDNCYVVESYIVNKERGICPKEYSNIEDGSWVVSVKIENDDVWSKIINNEVIGFSIETLMTVGKFSDEKHDEHVEQAKKLGITPKELEKLLEIFK